MLQAGTLVRVLSPFTESFPGEYLITEVVEGEIPAYILGEQGGFDAAYLEEIV